MKTIHKKFLFAIIIVAIVVLSVDRLTYIHRVAYQPSHSFVSYYTASVLLVQDEPVYQFYDGQWFSAHVSTFTPNIEEYFQPNPPTTALLMLPLANLSHLDARLIWTLFTLICVVIAVAWVLFAEKFTLYSGTMAIFVLLLYQPLYANFKYAQVYGVLFVVLTAILYCYKHHYDKLVGILLGLIIILKLTGYLFIPLLLLKQRWMALFASGITVLTIAIFSLPQLGIDSWLTFFDVLPEYNQRPSLSVTAYQSVSGFFKHLFVYHKFWNPSPMVDSPLLATSLSVVFLLVLLGFTFWKSYRTKHIKLIISALVLLTVLMSPVSLDYHYAIVLLPILLLIAYVPNMSRRHVFMLIIGIFMLSVDYPYQQNQYEQTLLSIMAYPKLMGDLLLLGLTLHLMSYESNES